MEALLLVPSSSSDALIATLEAARRQMEDSMSEPELTIRICRRPGIGDRAYPRHLLFLCDAQGHPLPGQQEVVLTQDPKGTTATVTFIVDGKKVALIP
jgi:hypothetical protein